MSVVNDSFMPSSSEASALALVLIIWLSVMVVCLAIGLVSYILSSLSLHTIAKRRGIANGWLAWLPVANNWVIGSIADYNNRRNGINSKWRVTLLVLSIVSIGLVVFFYVYFIALMFSLGLVAETDIMTEELSWKLLIGIIPAYLGLLIGISLATALSFCQNVCVCKVFEATKPQKAIKYFLISLLLPLGYPICLMCCRNSDYGIPKAPVAVQPAAVEAPQNNTIQ